MRRQKLFVDPRHIMKTVEMRCRQQFHQVAIATLIFRHEGEVICRIAARARPIFMRSGRDVGLTTDDRFDPGTLRFLVKFNRAK